ncbi:T/G mismatch-specific endonuclease [Bryocella elongata]|uniref:Very short patch repair endonuclease n=1 Tax=Bryocella elongata TaxID=863522 RepID=A0A1H5XM44_9BACT|nr:very short patch repair endonuclease [Bryocella elongata]SEG12801.1 T/G mismatch-specific endonuclease [Bryocella elongata]
MDKLSQARRSENMRRIKSLNTSPEISVRRLIFGMGYRFRLHSKALPGRPDLVFPGRRAVIFVHGCFWHQHTKCNEGRIPSSRPEYWAPKLAGNVARDTTRKDELRQLGWRVMVIWECEVMSPKTAAKIKRFLGKPGPNQPSAKAKKLLK